MSRTIIDWNAPITVYRLKRRYTGNDRTAYGAWSKAYPYCIDFKQKIAEFRQGQFPIYNWTQDHEVKEWLSRNLPNTNGIYVLCIRCWLIQPTRKRKKRTLWRKKRRGRPTYSRKKLAALGIYWRPRQRRMVVRISVLKFEMGDEGCVRLFEKKARRKRRPYNKPRYEVLRQLKRNKTLSERTPFF